MMKARSKQMGITMSGFIVTVVILVMIAIFGMRLIPVYMENGKIQRAFEEIVNDPGMQTASIAEIKNSYSKRAETMNDVKNVSQNEIEISKEGGRLSLSASYSKKIPLAGNVSLLVEFNPSASK